MVAGPTRPSVPANLSWGLHHEGGKGQRVSAVGISSLAGGHHHPAPHLLLVVLFSLASAASYGMAAVLQHHTAVRQPAELSMSTRLLGRLLHRPLWILGTALDGVGYLFQFLALRRGSLPLVEPLLVLSLVFALPVAARLDRRRISLADVSAAGTIAAGLALFLGLARPGAGHPHASAAAWATLTVAIAVSCGILALAGRAVPRHRAVLLAGGSGTAFGYVAAVTERTGHLLAGGVVHTLTSWEPYALVPAAGVALLMTQSAFHAGDLRLSLPTLTVAQPVVAVAIGVALFGEHVDVGGLAPVFESLGMVLATFGVFVLARSPTIGLSGTGTDGRAR